MEAVSTSSHVYIEDYLFVSYIPLPHVWRGSVGRGGGGVDRQAA